MGFLFWVRWMTSQFAMSNTNVTGRKLRPVQPTQILLIILLISWYNRLNFCIRICSGFKKIALLNQESFQFVIPACRRQVKSLTREVQSKLHWAAIVRLSSRRSLKSEIDIGYFPGTNYGWEKEVAFEPTSPIFTSRLKMGVQKIETRGYSRRDK